MLRQLVPVDSVAPLMRCKLWPGSMLQVMYKYGGFTWSDLEQRINSQSRCDDLTADELEELAAMKQVLAGRPK